MRPSELRERPLSRAIQFAWEQWSQMGISAAAKRTDPWAADPEALLLMTFELGRDEPRLFDEAFDWVVANERLLSVQRLRNLCVDDEDRALVGAALSAAGRLRRRQRLTAIPPTASERQPELFYRRLGPVMGEEDPAFREFGFLKQLRPKSEVRGAPPDMLAPINFALRLRNLLGVSVRAEVIRVLLGAKDPFYSVGVISASTGYAKRNVQEALGALRAAGVVSNQAVAGEPRIAVPLEQWAALLDVEQLPVHRDWLQLFNAVRLVLRWLQDPAHADRSDYMLASEARLLVSRIAPDLWFAGIPADTSGPSGAKYWDHFEGIVEELTHRLP